MPEMFHFRPIGRIVSAGAYRFEAPRQPVFAGRGAFLAWEEPELMRRAAEDLEGFERIWIIFVFDRNPVGRWKPKLRPPRSPDGKRYSVLATRSPHRPNAIGLSLVKIEKIEYDKQIKIHISGVDFLDQTPVLDIKPYLPHIESKPNAKGGFTENRRSVLEVAWKDDCVLPEHIKTLIEQTIAQDPRPAHQHTLQKEFVFDIAGYTVRFVCEENTAIITNVQAA